jgi:predicted dithiol-disulfide oxidoreductase (DUF899 family)
MGYQRNRFNYDYRVWFTREQLAKGEIVSGLTRLGAGAGGNEHVLEEHVSQSATLLGVNRIAA